jgi:hypothetical protein
MIGAELRYFTFVHLIEDILGEFYSVNLYLKKIFSKKVISEAIRFNTPELCSG